MNRQVITISLEDRGIEPNRFVPVSYIPTAKMIPRRKRKKKRKQTGLNRSYKHYLRSKHWRKIAEQVKAERIVCEGCGSREKLNVHHGTYENIGFESSDDLFLVCEECHYSIHERSKRFKDGSLLEATRKVLDQIRLASALLTNSVDMQPGG